MVVAEHQDVRQLDGRVAAHSLTRRDTLGNGALSGANGAGRAGVIVVGVQIDHADQALADGAILQRALHIDVAVRVHGKDVLVHVLLHRRVDLGGVRSLLLGAKLGLGEDQVDGGNGALRVLAHAIPVRCVRGKLVAGNDGPLFHMVSFRHQDICG